MSVNRNTLLTEIIYPAIDDLFENQGKSLQKDPNTVLFGRNSSLASLDLLTLVISVEERLEDIVGRPIRLLGDDAMKKDRSPFRTVETLADFIHGQLAKDNR